MIMRSEGNPTWKTHGPPSHQDMEHTGNEHFPVKSIVDAADGFCRSDVFFTQKRTNTKLLCFSTACSQKE